MEYRLVHDVQQDDCYFQKDSACHENQQSNTSCNHCGKHSVIGILSWIRCRYFCDLCDLFCHENDNTTQNHTKSRPYFNCARKRQYRQTGGSTHHGNLDKYGARKRQNRQTGATIHHGNFNK